MTAFATVVMLVTQMFPASDVRADAATTDPHGAAFMIPPSPAQAEPSFALELHTGLTMPLDNEALCPASVGCVLEAGGGVGASLERRFPNGFGVLMAYDAWFIDSDSVYELAVQQLLRGGVRYTMPTEYVFHPIFEGSLGLMGLGDIFRFATIGGVVQAFAGAEIELNETFGVRLGIGMRGFTHTAFRTNRDGVRRGQGVFSEAAFLEVGLTIM